MKFFWHYSVLWPIWRSATPSGRELDSTSSAEIKKHRLQGLDALRGAAALAVVLFHYTSGFKKVIHDHHDRLFFNFPFPAIGVEVFFAISGFVIFMTLERCKSGKDFFVSRFARIYPAFFACVLATACVRFATDVYPGQLTILDVMLNLPLVVGLLGKTYVDPSCWTLTLEMSFYASLAFFYYGVQQRVRCAGGNFGKLQGNPLILALFVWLLVGLIGRSIDGVDLYSRIAFALNLQHSHLFVAGIAVYGFYQRRTLVPAVLLLFAVAMGSMHQWGHVPLSAPFKLLLISGLVWLAASIKLKGYPAKLAVFFGSISYSLYLIHQVIGYVIIDKLEGAGVNSNVAVILAIIFAILFASLIRRVVEIPAQSMILDKYSNWKLKRSGFNKNIRSA